jgi:uncharacterized Zn finger protein (UPF0148 family)
MPSPNPPVRVVQCPKCGSPIEGASPGEIVTCSYCGATLEVAAGASGHPIAKLATIETSTVYLARTEHLKRVREQLARKEAELEDLQQALDQYQQTLSSTQGQAWKLAIVGGALIGLLISGSSEMTYCGGAALSALALWFVIVIAVDSKQSKARASAEERAAPLLTERSRLAQRVAQLEAGLDDLARKL